MPILPPPASSSSASRSGVLYKRSDYLKEWKPRHFTLEGFSLRYALPDAPLRVKDSLDLAMCRITRCDAVVNGPQTFHVVTVQKIGTSAEYVLGALSGRDADEWVSALKAAAGAATRRVVTTVQGERRAEAVRESAAARREFGDAAGAGAAAAEETARRAPRPPAAPSRGPAASEPTSPAAAPPASTSPAAARRSPARRRKMPSVPPAPVAAARPAPVAAAPVAAAPAPSAADAYLAPAAPAEPPADDGPRRERERREAAMYLFLAPPLAYVLALAAPALAPWRGVIFFAATAAVIKRAEATVGLALLAARFGDDLSAALASALKLD